MGRAYAAKSWHSDAARELSRAAELQPENLDSRVDLGRVLVRLEAWDDVLRSADLIAAKDPDNAFAGYLRAAALNAKGQREEALKAIAKALKSVQPPPELHTVHGDILTGLGRPAEAEQAYRAALHGNQNDATALVRLGDVLRRQSRPEEARQLFEQAKAVQPTSATARLALSALLADAAPLLQRVLKDQPDHVVAALMLADLYAHHGQHDQSVPVLEAAGRANPELPALILPLANLYIQAGRYDDAIERLAPLLKANPGLVQARMLTGLARFRKLDLAGAAAQYEEVNRINPKIAHNRYQHNNIAWIYATQGKNLDEALALAQKAHELAPNHASILDTLGFVHYRRGEYQKAEPILKKATEIAANDATGFYHLGMTYYKLGRRDDAAFALRRSLQLHATSPNAAEIRGLLDELRK